MWVGKGKQKLFLIHPLTVEEYSWTENFYFIIFLTFYFQYLKVLEFFLDMWTLLNTVFILRLFLVCFQNVQLCYSNITGVLSTLICDVHKYMPLMLHIFFTSLSSWLLYLDNLFQIKY